VGEKKEVNEAASIASSLSSNAPRLRATWPPHGSMFSLSVRATLNRTVRVRSLLNCRSSLASNWFDSTMYGTLPVSIGKPARRRTSATVPTG